MASLRIARSTLLSFSIGHSGAQSEMSLSILDKWLRMGWSEVLDFLDLKLKENKLLKSQSYLSFHKATYWFLTFSHV